MRVQPTPAAFTAVSTFHPAPATISRPRMRLTTGNRRLCTPSCELRIQSKNESIGPVVVRSSSSGSAQA